MLVEGAAAAAVAASGGRAGMARRGPVRSQHMKQLQLYWQPTGIMQQQACHDFLLLYLLELLWLLDLFPGVGPTEGTSSQGRAWPGGSFCRGCIQGDGRGIDAGSHGLAISGSVSSWEWMFLRHEFTPLSSQQQHLIAAAATAPSSLGRGLT